jgi:hypothetical protein
MRMLRIFDRQGYVDEPWRIRVHKMAKTSDRVWLLEQGRGPKGIFGFGEITSEPRADGTGNGKTQMMAPVRFTALVDFKQFMLIGEDVIRDILPETKLRAQASGYPLDDEKSEALQKLLATGSVIDLSGSDDWTPTELRMIVADYFGMLMKELAGETYSKTEHRIARQRVIRRSPGSICRKHSNISAVLHKLGLSWIPGYKPLVNYQEALVDFIEAELDEHAADLERLEPESKTPPAAIDPNEVFVDPPSEVPETVDRTSLARIIQKFDRARRDAANRRLGEAGERFVVALERARLLAAGQPELAGKIAWVSQDIW